ncbi:centromere protein Scm3-domain-containing protein [Lipomyces arxii]|uniref:centromere protein Scm3-domain-containing protein n=1 Tax=Lipomyces arxii TaxID=56418 RepID=UPI0034CD2D42
MHKSIQDDDNIEQVCDERGTINIEKERHHSLLKLKNRWEEIFERFSDESAVSDVVDLNTWEIVEDNGHLRSLGMHDIDIIDDEDADDVNSTDDNEEDTGTEEENEDSYGTDRLRNLDELVSLWSREDDNIRQKRALDDLVNAWKEGYDEPREDTKHSLEDGRPNFAEVSRSIDYALGLQQSQHEMRPRKRKPQKLVLSIIREISVDDEALESDNDISHALSDSEEEEADRQPDAELSEDIADRCGTYGYHCGRSFCFSCIEE